MARSHFQFKKRQKELEKKKKKEEKRRLKLEKKAAEKEGTDESQDTQDTIGTEQAPSPSSEDPLQDDGS